MRNLFLILSMCSFPALSWGQQSEFQKELQLLNEKFSTEKSVMLTQRYLFSLDSPISIPFDSGVCVIQKNDRVFTSRFNGVESFTDTNYIIKLSTPDKYMLVSKNNHEAVGSNVLFSQGLSNFRNLEKKEINNFTVVWKLSGGENEVRSAEIIYDPKDLRIRSILTELSPSNPLLIQFNNKKNGLTHKMFIRIEYTYSSEENKDMPQFSDYVHEENNVYTAVGKFFGYQIKFIK